MSIFLGPWASYFMSANVGTLVCKIEMTVPAAEGQEDVCSYLHKMPWVE
jgi:hypothetical protein